MEKNGCVMNGSFEDNASSSANGAVPKLPVRQDLCDGNSLSCQPLPPVVKRNNQLHLANLAGNLSILLQVTSKLCLNNIIYSCYLSDINTCRHIICKI